VAELPDRSRLSSDEIDAHYRQRMESHAEERHRLTSRDRSLSIARGLLFLIIVILSIAALSAPLLWWTVAAVAVLFLVLAGWQEQVAARRHQISRLQLLHERQLARRHRQWERLGPMDFPVPSDRQAIARDLDLFGARSLFAWLCQAHTPMGRRMLRDWLLYPAEREEVLERQRLVAALAAEFDWREELQLHGMLLESLEPRENRGELATDQFLEWAEGPQWLAQRRWLKALSWIVPVSAILLLLALFSGAMTANTAVSLGLLLAIFSMTLNVMFTGRIHDTFDQISGRSDRVRHYQGMLDVATRLPERVGPLPVGSAGLRQVSRQGLDRLARLHRIIRIANARRDGLLGIFHLAAQIVFLWEVHLLARLEAWQQRWGSESRQWFESIGRLEALASLAAVAYDHPHWTFPVINPSAKEIEAQQLGHPLLAETERVTNDVRVGPGGTFVLVTGSNMSGKSTLLRTVGLNSVLAQAGSVVCAGRLVLPPLEIETSIRIADSLADGVSLYLAELRRMKEIIDRARQLNGGPRRLLYLLDEILHGTNSRERQVAVERVVKHLLDQGAIGMVSTHDLELASVPGLQNHCHPVHLRETLYWEGNRRNMSFDYKLHPGLSTTTNALVLLEMVGLTTADSEPSP
jgi:ABC-type multidrug transport system fused ATPase/permease subunit